METEELFEQLTGLLLKVTPQVQAMPPAEADVDVTGALRFFDTGPYRLAQIIQLRALALCGTASSIGSAGNRAVAAMACAAASPGRIVDLSSPAEEASFLRPRAVQDLHGAGPATARALSRYGLHTIGAVADVPLGTLQRILGAAQGRLIHDRARGRDDRPVSPGGCPPLPLRPLGLSPG
ncbi:hypothetical protein [Streptomyces sp. NPDC059816]|uniref:DNA polymerase thumb domain-containing protein n=1 Tax=Streptomyces sp. NPDC059816 TaxID=3346960 RepID=UPI00364B0E48